MNDFRYVPYDEAIAAEYRKNQTAIVRLFKETKCRVIHGPEGDADMEGIFAVTEKARGKLAAAVRDSLKPVNHEITIVAVP